MGVKGTKKTKKPEVIQMKRLFLAVLCIMVIGTVGYAASTADINVRVSITGANLSVSVLAAGTTTTTWDAGGNGVGTWSVMSSSVNVINDSGGVTETYRLLASNATRLGGTTWTLSDTPGPEQYSMRAKFNGSTQPSNDDTGFPLATTKITGANQTCDVATWFAGTENGVGVVNNGLRGIWVRVGRPTSTIDTAEHWATLVITAILAS